MAATVVAKAMDERVTEETAIDISGSMDCTSNPAKYIGDSEAIKLSIFSEDPISIRVINGLLPRRPFGIDFCHTTACPSERKYLQGYTCFSTT
jgi:hypothetical protein